VWGRPDDFTYVNPADINTDWFVNLHNLQPNLLTYQSTSGSNTTTGYARRILDKRASGVTPRVTEITLETAFSWERNIDYYHDLGEKVGVSFYKAWVPQVAGDFTGDGIVDARDYVKWRDEAGQTGSALQADGNQDGVVDVNDYNLWRSHFGQVAGSGSGAGQATVVPEPASLLMLLVGSALFISQRRRKQRG